MLQDLWDFTSHPPKTLACTAEDAGKTLYALDCEQHAYIAASQYLLWLNLVTNRL